VLFFDTEDDPEKEKRAINIAKSQCVDGIILGSIYVDDEVVDLLENLEIEYVMLNRASSNSKAPYIRSEDIKGMMLSVDHLAKLGHRKIALLSGPLYADTALRRLEGYRKGLLNANIAYNSQYVIETKFDDFTGYTACEALLRLEEPPTAICSGNDMVAVGAIKAIQNKGLSVPGDISVVGYNNIWICDKLDPALTTIDISTSEMGRHAFKTLLRLIQKKDIQKKELDLEPHLIVRKSTTQFVPNMS
jgi:DNA-binding LacI/PurR family transcriptional regulator